MKVVSPIIVREDSEEDSESEDAHEVLNYADDYQIPVESAILKGKGELSESPCSSLPSSPKAHIEETLTSTGRFVSITRESTTTTTILSRRSQINIGPIISIEEIQKSQPEKKEIVAEIPARTGQPQDTARKLITLSQAIDEQIKILISARKKQSELEMRSKIDSSHNKQIHSKNTPEIQVDTGTKSSKKRLILTHKTRKRKSGETSNLSREQMSTTNKRLIVDHPSISDKQSLSQDNSFDMKAATISDCTRSILALFPKNKSEYIPKLQRMGFFIGMMERHLNVLARMSSRRRFDHKVCSRCKATETSKWRRDSQKNRYVTFNFLGSYQNFLQRICTSCYGKIRRSRQKQVISSLNGFLRREGSSKQR